MLTVCIKVLFKSSKSKLPKAVHIRFQLFMKNKIDDFQEPFFTTLFSLSSHEPFNVPKKYENFFPKGNVEMHEVIGYSRCNCHDID